MARHGLMSERASKTRREVRECICGQRIVYEIPEDGGKLGEEDGSRVIAISTETGASILQCPRCATAVDSASRTT